MMKRPGINKILLALSILLITTAVQAGKRSIQDRPNVLIINVDDMGYGDPSCYGGTLFETPNIDRLAKEGIRFTNGYVSSSVCSPSRHGLLTGCYQQRFGVQWNHDTWKIPGSIGDQIVPGHHRFINQAFSDAGYVTAMAGKIGISTFPQTTFDYAFSLTSSGCNYFPDKKGNYGGVDGTPKPKSGWTYNYWGPEREGEEYITDRCGRQCIEFIEEHKDRPFFFYLAFNAPHTPLQAKKTDLPRVSHIESEAARLYTAMVLAIDDNVGKILDCLEKLKLRENTIVVFLSDNGPANPVHLSIPDWWPEDSPLHLLGQRGPLSGFKGNFREGGIRIPYIISWPGHLDQGIEYHDPAITLDLYPTLCAAAHVSLPDNTRLDGIDLMPCLLGHNSKAPDRTLFWYANRMGAARKGKWKFLVEDNRHYLFDLEKDIGETENMARKNPDIMQKIFGEYISHRNEMPPCRNPFIRPIDIPSPDVIGLPVLEPK